MEGQVVLDGGARLNRLDLEGGADVGQHRGAERQRLGVVLLPSLVFGAEVEGARVLEIGGENDGLVSGLARKLDSEVPSVESDEDKVEVLGGQVLGSKGVESGDCISKGTRVPDVLPSQGSQARWRGTRVSRRFLASGRTDSGVGGENNYEAWIAEAGAGNVEQIDGSAWSNLLHRGVMGVLTGLTRTLSCVI